MRKEPAFTISPAPYSKGCVAVQNTSDGSGFKSRIARLAEALGARWSNRGHAYILRESQGPIIQALHDAGWDAPIRFFDHSPAMLIMPDDKTQVPVCEARKMIKTMTFAAQLRAERKRLGLTQAQAAALLDTPARTYWEYEAGKTIPAAPYREGALARLAKAK